MTRPDETARTAVIHAEIIGKRSLGKDYFEVQPVDGDHQ